MATTLTQDQALFIIPPGTPCEMTVIGGDGSWLKQVTTVELRPTAFYSMGLGKFTFHLDGWRIRVATKDVLGTWGRKQDGATVARQSR